MYYDHPGYEMAVLEGVPPDELPHIILPTLSGI